MGWVNERIKDEVAYRLLPKFWNAMRDAVGTAAEEFRGHSLIDESEALTWSDCRTKARCCVRVNRRGNSIEVYLDESDKTLKTFMVSDATTTTVCEYRLGKSRADLELFIQDENGSRVLTEDQACEKALEGFLFNPLPIILPGA